MVSINGADGFNSINKLSGYSDLKPLREIRGKEFIPMQSNGKSLEKDLEKNLAMSPLDERIPNKATLKKMGFNVPFGGKMGKIEIPKQECILDMNGGKTYQNKNGDTIRISSFEAEMATKMPGSTSVEYNSKDGTVKQSMLYDPDGNPLKGKLIVENEDGSIETFEYEYDLDGNKKVTSYNVMVKD